MATKVEAFECDPDFCPSCGSILPLPGLEDVVSCSLCNLQKDTCGKIVIECVEANLKHNITYLSVLNVKFALL